MKTTDKVIPILPCPNIKEQAEFYQQLGFELVNLYTSPNPYSVMRLGTIELHFYGSRKIVPVENPTMCFIKVEDVDAVYSVFASGLKKQTGKIPRTGIPRISKVRDLSSDRRFTLTDTGGNTFFIGSPLKLDTSNFFRDFQNEEFAKNLIVLYDVVYSKEDCILAAKMLPKLMAVKDLLNALDKAKFLLIILDMQKQLGQEVEIVELQALVESNNDSSDDWEKIKNKYLTIMQDE